MIVRSRPRRESLHRRQRFGSLPDAFDAQRAPPDGFPAEEAYDRSSGNRPPTGR